MPLWCIKQAFSYTTHGLKQAYSVKKLKRTRGAGSKTKLQPISALSLSAIALEAFPLWLMEFFCSLVIWAVVMPNSGT